MAAGKATRGRDMRSHKQNTLPQALPAGAGHIAEDLTFFVFGGLFPAPGNGDNSPPLGLLSTLTFICIQ